MISIACLPNKAYERALLTSCTIAANDKISEHEPAWALHRAPAFCQVSESMISSRTNDPESYERRILPVPPATHKPRKSRKLSVGKAGLDRRMESPRAGRSGAKSESCRSTVPERLSLRWVGRILGSAVSNEPSCPSRLHLLHNGASTQTTLYQVSARTSGEHAFVPSCCINRRTETTTQRFLSHC